MKSSCVLPTRRLLLRAGPAGLVLSSLILGASGVNAATRLPLVEVWKSPDCGCCVDWIRHLEAHGFSVRPHDLGNAEARARFGMPARLGSCHTARLGDYVIEGHVPAPEIIRLLRTAPNALGLSVPGMPIGSPGMDGPIYRGRQDPYHVLLVGRDGSTTVFASYPLAQAQSGGSGSTAAVAPAVQITEAWARATVPGQRTAAGYLEIRSAASDRLVAFRPAGEVAARGELHTMRMDGDRMVMREVAGFTLVPGETLSLRPGGNHLMFMDLARPLKAGEHVEVTLVFEKAGPVTVRMPVRDLRETREMSMPPAGHRHRHP